MAYAVTAYTVMAYVYHYGLYWIPSGVVGERAAVDGPPASHTLVIRPSGHYTITPAGQWACWASSGK